MQNKNREDNQCFCLLGASFATNNMGVSALTAGTIEGILHSNSGAEITLLDYGKEEITYQYRFGDREIPVRLLNIRFSKKLYLKNNVALLIFLSLLIKLIPFKHIRKRIISRNHCLNHIAQADMVASIAGGDSFSDIYGLARLLYVSLPQFLVLFAGKNLVLLPQTIGPFKGSLAKCLGKYILKRAAIVYSRDHFGLQEAKDLLHPEDRSEKFKFCYDVGFVVEPIKPRETGTNDFVVKINSSRFLVGLNVSGLLFMGGYTHKNMFGLNIDYKKLIYDLIDYFISEKNLSVLLVPHVFGYGKNSESDSVVCEKIYEELKARYPDKLFLVKGNYNQSEIKYIIGMCDFFVGSRMHACIAALSQCIPAVGIAYSKKFSGVFESIQAGHLVADPRMMNEKEILEVIENAFEDRQNIKEALQKIIPQVKKEILSIFAH